MKQTLVFSILLLLPIIVSAGEPVCCCNFDEMTAQTQVPMELPCAQGFEYKEITAENIQGVDPQNLCTELCAIPPEIEFINTSMSCGDRDFTPAPSDLEVLPLRGEKQMRLTWNSNCTEFINAFVLERCDLLEGSCADVPEEIAMIPGDLNEYIDGDHSLEFNKEYKYYLRAIYRFGEESIEISAPGALGNLECSEKRTDDYFCISQPFYDDKQDYLTTYGYELFSAKSFKTTKWESQVYTTFHSKFNSAYFCNELNQLINVNSCPSDKICVAEEKYFACSINSGCPVDNVKPFGVAGSVESCEGPSNDPNFCFFDKSHSIADACYSCSDAMKCADYRSEDSCVRDNCRVGACTWTDIYPEMGVGICVDQQFDNCGLCDFLGTPSMQNLNAYNAIFDKCSAMKADALSSAEQCYYDPDSEGSRSCDTAVCMDLRPQDCGSISITLDDNNEIIQPSDDVCSLGLCELLGPPDTGNCVKNADGGITTRGREGSETATTSFEDCLEFSGKNKRLCEEDMFPPNTTIVPQLNSAGKVNSLMILRFDKLNRKTAPISVDEDHVMLFYCIYEAGTTPCTDYKQTETDTFVLSTHVYSETVANAILLDPTLPNNDQKVFDLFESNVIRYYGVDKHNNVEVVNELEFETCASCTAPEVMDITLLNGKKVNDLLISSSQTPEIELVMSRPTELTVSQIVYYEDEKDKRIGLVANDTLSKIYTLRLPSGTELDEGFFTVRIDGKDQLGTYMDEEYNAPMILDLYAPSAEFYIIDEDDQKRYLGGSEFNTSEIELYVEFDEAVTIKEAQYTSRVLKTFTADTNLTDITDILETEDNRVFRLEEFEPGDGFHEITIIAEDIVGHEVQVNDTFYISSEDPVIHLRKPTFGVSPNISFDIEIETLTPTKCTYGTSELDDTIEFNEGDAFVRVNTLNEFGGVPQENVEYDFIVVCMDIHDKATRKTFKLSRDSQMPIIKNITFFPEKVLEKPFEVEVKVTTERKSFCALDINAETEPSTISQFEQLPIRCNGFYQTGKTDHAKTVTLPGLGNHKVSVSCISLGELGPTTLIDHVPVLANESLKITSKTVSPQSDNYVSLGIEINKKAICTYKRDSGGAITFSGAQARNSHYAEDWVDHSGTYTYKFECRQKGINVINGTPEVAFYTQIVQVDLNDPRMVFVDDNSSFEDPEFTYLKSQLQVMFDGEDNETGIKEYKLSLSDENGNDILNNSKYLTEDAEDSIMVSGLNLSDQTTYYFNVFAVDKVNRVSQPLESDGITVDFSLAPPTCSDGNYTPGETDVDCGGDCEPCGLDKKCINKSDCASNICNQETKRCEGPKCDDGKKNGDESDVDCGGSCKPCIHKKTCNQGDGCMLGCFEVDLDCGEGKTCGAGDGCKASCEFDPDCCGSTCAAGDGCVQCSTGDVDCIGDCSKDGACVKGCDPVDLDCGAGASCGGGDGCISGCNVPDPDCAGATCEAGDGCMAYCNPIDPDCEGGSCNTNADCVTNYCDPTGQCAVQDSCSNSILDGSETDKDCGGACPIRCWEGKGCYRDSDCKAGLACEEHDGVKVCSKPSKDSDGGGATDEWEKKWGFDPNDPADDQEDTDGDGLTNAEEEDYGTNPRDDDTDNDGYSDGDEIAAGSDPNSDKSQPPPSDDDDDGIPNYWEEKYGFDPNDPSDAFKDNDKDGLTNLDEYKYFKRTNRAIDPNNKDTDDDGWSDKKEINKSTNPVDPNDHPKSKFWMFFLLFLALILIVILSYLGYNYYEEYEKEQEKKQAKKKKLTTFFQNPFKTPAKKKKKKRTTKKKKTKRKKSKKAYVEIKVLKEKTGAKKKAKHKKQEAAFAKLAKLTKKRR